MKLQHRTKRVLALAITVASLGAINLNAQTPQDVDLAVTLVVVQAAHVAGAADFRLYGGSIEVHADFFHGLGAVANVTEVHENTTSPLLAPLDLVTVTFGPRYTFAPKLGKRRVSVFAQALVGEANGFHSLFATGTGPAIPPNGTTDSANSLAVQAGGGLDVRVTRRFSVRAFEADYLRTQLPNGSNNTQSNVRFAAGVVFRIQGRP